MQNQIPGLQLVATEGSLWSGRASRLQFQGQTVTDLSWRWRPLALLMGRFEYQLQGVWADEPASLRMGAGLSGSTYLADVSAKVASQTLLAPLLPGNVTMQGQLIMELEKVDISTQGLLPILYGQIRWPQAEVTSPLNLNLGDVVLDLAPGEDKTLGKLTAQNGQLLIDGTLELAQEGDYALLADVRTSGQVDPAVTNGLNTFAEFRNGQYQLDLSGNLLSLLPH
ncbi:MAG: type II secretion system protein N [Gammaproteobacteria bacterium]